ncbi:MAG: phosphomannomutase/phosphoglucomutase [Chloroflexi bacterium]|nr:phosphomannomutase/phosphoglucomutase [Chloroflexota bacterium]
MAKLKKSMFREYDLRGQVNDEQINERSIDIITKAYGTMLRKRDIDIAVIGHDYRKTSEWITQAAIKGLLSTGVNVINLGMVLTPMMYSAQYQYQSKGGVMVTASHNPIGWSGFKLALGQSYTLGPVEMEELYQLTVSEEFATGSGTVRTGDFLEDYLADMLKRVNITQPIRVVVNAGNGTPGPIVPLALRKAGCEVIDLYTDLDWDFPHYYPNPALVEMMEDTGKKVVEAKADIGFALDGDGDRLGVTNEHGEVVWPDRYLILLARQILEEHPGAKVIFDVKCSQALPEDIEAHGGTPIMWKTGHSYIKQKLWAEKAPLAGEMSGHIFFGPPDYYGFDDAVFTALKLAEFVSRRKEPMSALIDQTPYYISTPTFQVACADEIKYEVVDKLTQEFKDEGYDVIDINGARVNFEGGWGLVRASSNLPVLVMRFEAKTEERKEELVSLFREKFAKYPEIGTEWESG